jgi:hypothetical protein
VSASSGDDIDAITHALNTNFKTADANQLTTMILLMSGAIASLVSIPCSIIFNILGVERVVSLRSAIFSEKWSANQNEINRLFQRMGSPKTYEFLIERNKLMDLGISEEEANAYMDQATQVRNLQGRYEAVQEQQNMFERPAIYDNDE